MDKKEHAIAYLAGTFAGDQAWEDFYTTFDASWQARQDKQSFRNYFDDEELASVLAWHFDKHAFAWFENEEIPALYGFSPRSLWQSGLPGRQALKALLMRLC